MVTETEEKQQGSCFTYIVRCADGTFYTGWTVDLQKRLHAHNSGTGARYTRSRRPVELAYYETFATKQEAMSREAAIKKLSRKEKLRLMNGEENG
ncbi:MAG: GIY-YIG nuclease family protein [Lachnospiraceae bacterium]|nr:GIY-YIG nuclease family protein [Lachnospiraceae bacterium]